MTKTREPYIKELELLAENHFPVYDFFNSIRKASFNRIYEDFSNGIGAGIECAICSFPDDLLSSGIHPSEVPNGISFSIQVFYDDNVVLDYSTFYYYLNIAYKRHIEMYPDTEHELTKLLEETKHTLENLNGAPLQQITPIN